MSAWRVKVVWLDGEEELLKEGDRVASFSSRRRAEDVRDFMLEGMEDEVQGIYVTQDGPK